LFFVYLDSSVGKVSDNLDNVAVGCEGTVICRIDL
jgi:hypothetical protein